MAGAAASAAEMIPQLEAARKLALGDPQVYNQVLPGILPIIGGPAAPLEVRRWGADFVAETFASPSLSNMQKEQLCSDVLPTLRNMLDTPGEDAAVVKSVVQASASIYPLVFRRMYVTHFSSCVREGLWPKSSAPILLALSNVGPSHSISHPDQALLWKDMTDIKLNILQRMDSAPPAVRICCVKFVQKVVHVETPGLIADPRVSRRCL